jgi:hypothetical protein
MARMLAGPGLKMVLGLLLIVLLYVVALATGHVPNLNPTYGHGPDWKCETDNAITNDPLCWKAPERPKK